jgi:hypothetical protein
MGRKNEEQDEVNYAEVKQTMEKYFSDKEAHYGGPIPNAMLFSKNNIELVARTAWGDMFEPAHKKLGLHKLDRFASPEENKKVNERVNHILDILSGMIKAKIPTHYCGGLLLLHLELCEGYE